MKIDKERERGAGLTKGDARCGETRTRKGGKMLESRKMVAEEKHTSLRYA